MNRPGKAMNTDRSGIIGWFVENPIAANLLMIVVITLGIMQAGSLQKESFPSMEPNSLTISVTYDSGSAQQAEEGIAMKIEDQLEEVSGIKTISSSSTANGATITVEKTDDYDLDTLLDDVKSQVDAISTFPADAKNPVIKKAVREEHAIWVQLYGEADRATLQSLGYRLKLDLLANKYVSRVTSSGWIAPMMAIEIDEGKLQAYNRDIENQIQKQTVYPQPSLEAQMNEIRRSYCGLCHPRCGTLLHLENNKVVKVTGDPNHPVTRGAICERGRLMVEHLYHPDRLNHPLKRVGEKGSGQWQQISWDQALDEVAGKLSALRDTYGAETLAFTHGTKRTYHWDCRRFYNLFGSPNTCGVNTICMCPSYATEFATYGGMIIGSEVPAAKCIVLWGCNASQSNPIGLYPKIIAAQKKGAKVIVIDPRRTKEAEKAEMWLQIRPGTDLALMLGWIRLIIEEDLYDREFVSNWTVGFEELKEAVAPHSPEKVAEITSVPPELVVQSARMYATNGPAVIPFGLGLDKQGVNATQCARARAIIRAITGNLEIPGGEVFSLANTIWKIRDAEYFELNEMLPESQRVKQLGVDQYPFFGFPGWERNSAANKKLPEGYMASPEAWHSNLAHAREVMTAIITGKPYPVTAAITLANNPLLALPNTKRVFEALKALQLYVVVDYYMTPSAALADYILPAASTVETSELWLTSRFCMACPQGIEPMFERRNSYDFYRGLGIRLGQEQYWPWETIEEVYDHSLEPVGLTFKQLVNQYGVFGKMEYRRYEKFGFGTPSGKVELTSSIFNELGAEPLPTYREPVWSPVTNPELAQEYPLILITGSRFMPMYQSEQRQIETARKKVPDPLVSIHPDTAAKLGLSEGDWAVISTPLGSIRQRVKVTDVMHPQMVDIQHSWWFPERDPKLPELFGVFDSNANVLCPDAPEFCSPEIGSWPHSALLCRVEKEQ